MLSKFDESSSILRVFDLLIRLAEDDEKQKASVPNSTYQAGKDTEAQVILTKVNIKKDGITK